MDLLIWLGQQLVDISYLDVYNLFCSEFYFIFQFGFIAFETSSWKLRALTNVEIS